MGRDIILIVKLEVGNIFTKVVGEKSEVGFVKDYLSFTVDGYSHSPKYRQGLWDGKKSMLKYKKFPTGLLPWVVKYLDDKKFPYELQDERGPLPSFEPLQEEFFGMQLSDHQMEAARSVLEEGVKGLSFPRGMIDAATAAGKDLIMAALHTSLQGSTIVLIEERKIFDKALDAFKGFDPGVVSSKKTDLRPFTIAMVKTLHNRLQDEGFIKEVSGFDALFYDECQGAGSNTALQTLYRINTPMRVFLSGTPLDIQNKESKLRVIGHSGRKLKKISNRELMDKGWSANVKVRILQNAEPPVASDRYDSEEEYRNRVEFSKRRVQDYARIIDEIETGQVMIAFRFHEHGDFLLEQLRYLCPDVGIEMVHGEEPEEEVNDRIQRFRDREIRVLIASTILKKGVNIHCIEALIMGIGGKSKEVIKQFVGRAVRREEGIEEVRVYDWFDEGNYVEKHSRKRLYIYKGEKFDIFFTYPMNRQFTPTTEQVDNIRMLYGEESEG